MQSKEIPFVGDLASVQDLRPRVQVAGKKLIQYPPYLIDAQLKSFEWFRKEGIRKLFALISPVTDPTGKKWTIEFVDFRWGRANRTVGEAIRKKLTYDAPLYVTVRLSNKRTGKVVKREMFLVDFPIMSDRGDFIFNGVTRVILHQLIRAEGVTFLEAKDSSAVRRVYMAKLRPQRGSWIEFVINKQEVIYMKMLQGLFKFPVTMVLKALGYGDNQGIIKVFGKVGKRYIEKTLSADISTSQEEAAITMYKTLRSDEGVSASTAIRYVKNLFFDYRRFYLGMVGRYQLNKKLENNVPLNEKNFKLRLDDLVAITKRLIEINEGIKRPDDVDSLTNRRVRSVGELLVWHLEQGVVRMEKHIRDKLGMYGDNVRISPKMVISAKPLRSAVDAFLGLNSLSRFMDQDNILAELENLRRVTASGVGGIKPERATFGIRDIHYSQYARVCPVKTPEKRNIGIVLHLSLYARINKYGFIEVMYRKVLNKCKTEEAQNRILREDTGKIESGTLINDKIIKKLLAQKIKEVKVVPFLSNDLIWVDPYNELKHVVTVSSVNTDEYGNILEKLVPARMNGTYAMTDVNQVTLADVTSSQVGSVSLSLIPFAGNSDSARLLMGTNMTNQAVPLVRPQAPIVGTGLEEFVARESGRAVYSNIKGVVKYVDSSKVIVKAEKKEKKYKLFHYIRSNQSTSFSQRAVVSVGDKVKKGSLLADGPSMQNGELALGTNLLVAYMFWNGFNFEDSFVVSERLLKEDVLTSIHIETYTVDIRDTKLGPEVITKDIPNVPERALRHLGEDGIVRTGAMVNGGDVLVGIIAPRGEQYLSAEERLLRAIFGESSKDVVNNSLTLPYGRSGIVMDTYVLSQENNDKLPPGVLMQVRVSVASVKKVSFGDKLSGRYGDKGTVGAILPVEDMPYLADGTPIDIVLNPLFVKRMNMGQAMETFYSNLAFSEGTNIAVPSLEKINKEWINKVLKKHNLPNTNKVTLYDGLSGQPFDNKVAVGFRYMLRLKHIASEKLHARSTGPYTLVSQQPLSGKAHMGGQRFGEMEVWALEAHKAAHTLQEMLTIKSDDVDGRRKAYKAILAGEDIEVVKTPASFKVLVKELNALGIKVDLIKNALAKNKVGTKDTEKEDNSK